MEKLSVDQKRYLIGKDQQEVNLKEIIDAFEAEKPVFSRKKIKDVTLFFIPETFMFRPSYGTGFSTFCLLSKVKIIKNTKGEIIGLDAKIREHGLSRYFTKSFLRITHEDLQKNTKLKKMLLNCSVIQKLGIQE